MKCKICGSSKGNQVFPVKEMMKGTFEEFDYLECDTCGCLQLIDIPPDMGVYYEQSYYTFVLKDNRNYFIKKLSKKRDHYIVTHTGIIPRILDYLYHNDTLQFLVDHGKIDYESRIMEVGCGAGYLLHYLENSGFKNITGIDPYLNEDYLSDTLKIHKKNFLELPDSEKYDLIMFQHSYEHMAEPKEILDKIADLLSENGVCLISMPVKSDYIWKRYGVNWVQIDAPRHFYVHTLNSFKVLVEDTNLFVEEVIFDSTSFQFWGSEQYKNYIPLESERSYLKNPKKSMFQKKDIINFEKKAKSLNKIEEGDEAVFILNKKKHF